MELQPRVVIVASFGLGSLLLAAGCGSESSGSSATLANIQGSSYVTIEPATTTTTILVPTTLQAGTSADAQTYTVVSGDSVSKIASLFDIEAEVLANFNSWPEGIQHPIFPGDVVSIPPGAAIPGATPAGDSSGGDSSGGDTDDGGDTATGQGCIHTIVQGDNPTRVARKYDITVDELANANITNPVYNTFLIGSTLNIPPNGDCG
jgi:LysM repeat protein